MNQIFNYPCAECGSLVQYLTKSNRTGFYLGKIYLIPETLEIPTCLNCGTEWVDDEIINLLDEFAQNQNI